MLNIKDQLDVIKISGVNAETFIQGQITNDITLLSEEEKSIYAGYCSPKGRLLAFFFITRMDANYFLFCPPCICEAISKRLSMYVLRAKVKVTCSSNNLDYFLIDEGDIQKVPDNLISKPQNKLQTTLNNNKSVSLTMLGGSKSYYFIFGDNKEITNISLISNAIMLKCYNVFNAPILIPFPALSHFSFIHSFIQNSLIHSL